MTCNSVLEYIDHEALPGVQREIHRVLRRKGVVAILGTSNRLWPREGHSRRWSVRTTFEEAAGFPAAGVALSPAGSLRGEIRAGFPDYVDLTSEDGGRLYLAMQSRMGLARWKLSAAAASSRPLRPGGLPRASDAEHLDGVAEELSQGIEGC